MTILGIVLFCTFFLLLYFFWQPKCKTSAVPVGLSSESSVSGQPSKELDMARRVQEALLSVEPPVFPGIHLVKKCVPAAELGGDFYAFVSHTDHVLSQKKKVPGIIEYVDAKTNYLGIMVGDVAGHGVSSALVMALSAGILTRLGQNHRLPSVIFNRANNDITHFISNSDISHVTSILGVLNTDTYVFTYATAGHPEGLLLRADGSWEFLAGEGVFLGMFPNEVYTDQTCQLQPGDRLFFYTDGITEAMNDEGDSFGLSRILSLAEHHKQASIEVLETAIFTAVADFCGEKGAHDDQTLVILEIGVSV